MPVSDYVPLVELTEGEAFNLGGQYLIVLSFSSDRETAFCQDAVTREERACSTRDPVLPVSAKELARHEDAVRAKVNRLKGDVGILKSLGMWEDDDVSS